MDLSGGITFKDWIGSGDTGAGVIGVINTIVVPLLFAFAFVAFVWGVVNYFFLHGGEDTKRAEGRQFAFWGIIGMVVLLSVWGLVRLVLSTLGLTPGI